MQMEPQASPNCEPQACLDCEPTLNNESIPEKDSTCHVTASSQNHDVQQPVKKQTRQWAAWTRQEEESFFTALRQVGKNFEKITCRVQSKNKDQVRHYYYRLVRRMNKLLGPGVCLDAKNSKDTNAAMLRWWSLLEKYSCKASKLHLKPRRFKIFVETLEHQLLKDQRKSKRRKSSQGEICCPAVHPVASNQTRVLGQDTHSVKVVLVDSQNINRLGSGKGSSVRRNVNMGINRSNCKGDLSSAKTMRQRRKPGIASTAAYKKWEKAAIAGVSLVADAAEHLEHGTIDKENEGVQNALGQTICDPTGKDRTLLQVHASNMFNLSNVQTPAKLKLQLFPIDETTRRALESDNHNPHLELTLSTRKKISSVLEHLNRKWGDCSIASGELLLFPYYIQIENLMAYQRWTQDSVLCAGDVHALIGSPPVFRLRYGWFSKYEPASATPQVPLVPSGLICNRNINICVEEQTNTLLPVALSTSNCWSENFLNGCTIDQQVFEEENIAERVPSSREVDNGINGCTCVDKNDNLLESSDGSGTASLLRKVTNNEAMSRQGDNKDDRRLRNGPCLSIGEWADSLTNVSVGDLLSEVPQDTVSNCVDLPQSGNCQSLQQFPFSCDSFDAAIAAHVYRHKKQTNFLPALAPSIWDAEETRDAFSFQKNTVPPEEVQSTSAIASSENYVQIGGMSPVGCDLPAEDLATLEGLIDDDHVDEHINGEAADDQIVDDNPANQDLMDDYASDSPTLEHSPKDLNGLTDMYWPDSLGPLELDFRSSRYHTEDIILSDSLGSLNRLLASSLDAFQNCSFFGQEKKEKASTVEGQEAVSFPDYKISSE